MDQKKKLEVCVTGGTGFIASHLIRALLHKGYNVRTTVRNPEDVSKTGFLWKMPNAKEQLRIVQADLMEEGSFDAAVSGVSCVFHTASPVAINPDMNPEVTFVRTHVQGNINVLTACTKSPSIKRIILTSSCSAIRYDYNHTIEDPPLDESIWSNIEYCKEYKMWYAMAKTLGEKEAHAFAKERGLDLVVINPSFVLGPMLTPTPTSTISLVLQFITTGAGEYPNMRIGWVHIDDVVTAHLLAFEVPSANGRYICSGEVAHFGDVLQMLYNKYPKLKTSESSCSKEKGNNIFHTLDTSKIQSLGLRGFKSLEQMIDDTIQSFHQHGLLEYLL
ncbi:unnamed protein product [Sphagnum troendelagicum]|uniref:NAD-dependent epimerase/dehydratase domain-containing protein n=1 Tax=Sphagnum troendelagicum TaxID=128251 RepID=A0ABP0U8V7_9BRYO